MLAASRRSFIASTVSAGGVALVRGRARAAQFEFKVGSQLPFDQPSGQHLGQMWSAVQRESGGRIAVQYFPNSVLGGEDAMFSQLRVGALQFQFMSPGTLASVVPSANIAYLGFAYNDAAQGLRAFDGPLGNYIRNEAAAKGLYAPRLIWNTGMGHLGMNTGPIRTPDDLKGLKIRVSGNKISVDLFKDLDANATPLGLAEVYTALQTKLVDGVASSLAIITSARWYEVLKYISLTNHVWFSQMLIANGDTWKRLPPDLQAIIERNNTKYSTIDRQMSLAADADLFAKLKDRKIAFNTVDQAPFRARLKPYFQYWANEFGPTEWGLLQSALGRTLV